MYTSKQEREKSKKNEKQKATPVGVGIGIEVGVRDSATHTLLPLQLQLAYVVRGTWHAAVGIAFNYAQRTVKMLKNANYALQHAKCNAGKIVAHNLCHTWLPDSVLSLSFCLYLSLWLSLCLSLCLWRVYRIMLFNIARWCHRCHCRLLI